MDRDGLVQRAGAGRAVSMKEDSTRVLCLPWPLNCAQGQTGTGPEHSCIAGWGDSVSQFSSTVRCPWAPKKQPLKPIDKTHISSQLLGDERGFRGRWTLSLIFLIWEMGIILVPLLGFYCEDDIHLKCVAWSWAHSKGLLMGSCAYFHKR